MTESQNEAIRKRPSLELATGCFAYAKEYEKSLWKCVSIALYQPRGWRGNKEPSFAPSKELLVDLTLHKVSVNAYERRYKEETLSKIDVDSVLAKYNGRVVFLSYAKTAFDYRHFLSDALIKAGYPCRELGDMR